MQSGEEELCGVDQQRPVEGCGALLLGNPIATSAVMVRRSVLLEHGEFRASMAYREDHELWLRLASKGATMGQVDAVMVDYLLHSGNNELAFVDEDNR